MPYSDGVGHISNSISITWNNHFFCCLEVHWLAWAYRMKWLSLFIIQALMSQLCIIGNAWG